MLLTMKSSMKTVASTIRDQSGSTPETPVPVTEVAIAVDRTLLMRRYAGSMYMRGREQGRLNAEEQEKLNLGG